MGGWMFIDYLYVSIIAIVPLLLKHYIANTAAWKTSTKKWCAENSDGTFINFISEMRRFSFFRNFSLEFFHSRYFSVRNEKNQMEIHKIWMRAFFPPCHSHSWDKKTIGKHKKLFWPKCHILLCGANSAYTSHLAHHLCINYRTIHIVFVCVVQLWAVINQSRK